MPGLVNQFNIRLTDDDIKQINKIKKKTKKTASSIVRNLIATGLKSYDRKKKNKH